MYALVQNETVVRVGPLPESWVRFNGSSVSGYNTMSDEEVALDGWLPLVENLPPLQVGQQYGPPTYTIGIIEVTADYPVQAEPAETLNQRNLEAKLSQLLQDATAAIATLQAQRDTAQVNVTSVATAQTVCRGLQDAIKDQARLQQEHMKRTVAIARLLTGAVDSTDNT
jgi:hypothetical protein